MDKPTDQRPSATFVRRKAVDHGNTQRKNAVAPRMTIRDVSAISRVAMATLKTALDNILPTAKGPKTTKPLRLLC